MMKYIIGTIIFLLALNAALAGAADRCVAGIVELPGVFGQIDPDGPPGSALSASVEPVSLHAQPDSQAPIITKIDSALSLEAEEYAYEAPGAIVYAVSQGWVLVRAIKAGKDLFGWVSPQAQGRFYSLADLVTAGLSYIDNWDGVLFEKPGGAKVAPQFQVADENQDVNVVASARHQGALWFQVEVLGPGRCEGEQPAVVGKGWVPAHMANGSANVWFYSRGC